MKHSQPFWRYKMSIIVFLFGMILLLGAIAMPDSNVRWIVILQNFLMIAGISTMFGGFLLAIGV